MPANLSTSCCTKDQRSKHIPSCFSLHALGPSISNHFDRVDAVFFVAQVGKVGKRGAIVQ